MCTEEPKSRVDTRSGQERPCLQIVCNKCSLCEVHSRGQRKGKHSTSRYLAQVVIADGAAHRDATTSPQVRKGSVEVDASNVLHSRHRAMDKRRERELQENNLN